MKKLRVLAASTAITTAALFLAGCTINLGSSPSPSDDMAGGMMHGTHNGSGFSGADIMFAQMMIPHHQQAVDMGTLAETRAMNPKVQELAASIKREQAPEILQMTSWLKKANAPLEMGHQMGMGGMMTEEQMAALEKASGTEFDKLYLAGMIAHHEGAIHMAQMVVDSNNTEAKALAEAIISSQTKQISHMRSLLKALK
jgi:uncharacterized protein (DUF305 family)